ncbi:RNA-directed DNA polymerase, eukaryota, reverse transcriptase zinc-binding domain protein [Tanacetum coccineum]|uniref:RNA-directed DNA polymerase, eukaryota, reverse transcriptase zinc-binding domain protein n=1 Tax=Tanacetum coccineum TaxID=301880 RepID=A0ABQ4ZX20_9ASTR
MIISFVLSYIVLSSESAPDSVFVFETALTLDEPALTLDEPLVPCLEGGRGVKEKDLNRNKKNTSSGISVSTDSEDTMYDDTPIGVVYAVQEGVTPYVVDMTVVMENSMDGLDAMLENDLWFILNNPIILKKWHPNENLMKEDISTIPVWVKLHGVLVTAFNEDGLSVIATKLGTPLMLDSYTSDMCMQSCGRSSYARSMIELRADVEFKDNIVVAMPKITREGHYTCNNTSVGEKKTMKKPSQTSRGVLVGPKMGFKPHKEYRHVPKKSTASSSGNKKKGEEPIIEVSNSNPFDVLNSFDNNVEFGTNGGATNLVNNEATSSSSSFMNVDNSSSGTTPIIDKIEKFEELLTSEQAIFVDKAVNPLKKVEFPDEYDSEYGVASVDNDMARSWHQKG